LGLLNVALGQSAGDSVLVRLANQLRATIRPGDVLARVGGDEFAIWQNGMDHLTAAERADALCSTQLFHDVPTGFSVTFSIGIAPRKLGGIEGAGALLNRAHAAAREAKGRGGGGWRVSHAPMRRGPPREA
jgi:diguanylate cyclase (GGDEF)-like protein